MISRIGLAISRVFERTAPDPFVIAILLTIFTALLALIFGSFPSPVLSHWQRAEFLLDSWRFDMQRPAAERVGLWRLLEFSMQMSLILVTGHALAVTRPVRAMIDAVARLPRTTAQAAACVSAIACAAALINWGLGLIVGALLAREVGRSMAQRGIAAHYPLIVAAGYMGLMVWHGGLSGSAPLVMTTAEGAAKALPPGYIAQLGADSGGGGVPLHLTLFSPLNLFVSLGLLAIVPLMFWMLAPRCASEMRSAAEFGMAPPSHGGTEEVRIQKSFSAPLGLRNDSLPDRLDRSWIIVWLLAIPLLMALVRFVQTSAWSVIGLNEVNGTMLALGLILHGSPRSYMRAAEDAARGCAGIIIQFPLYAGIMAMMQDAGLIVRIAEAFTAIGNQTTIPVLSFFSAGMVNLFVPSGGGQWAIQGPIALQAGLEAGVAPAKMIMSVAYGDQLTNMLQPFWALPLLAITGVRARDIVGYTATVMLIAMVWVMAGLLVF